MRENERQLESMRENERQLESMRDRESNRASFGVSLTKLAADLMKSFEATGHVCANPAISTPLDDSRKTSTIREGWLFGFHWQTVARVIRVP